jgi:hypothetical protein
MKSFAGYRTLSKLTFVLASGFLVASCSKTTGTGGTECLVWRSISWSAKDTPQTIEEVKLNNVRQKAWCGNERH